MDNRNFSEIEIAWLKAILSVEFLGKEIILEQLDKAQVSRAYNTGYISLKLMIDRSMKRFPYQGRVPLEMRVKGKNDIPIVFLLHVVDGFVDELEIFNADSSPIDGDIRIEMKEVIVGIKSGF